VGLYYIKTKEGTVYELDSTNSIQISLPSQATRFPVESGSVVSDHYVNKNITAQFSGTVSSIKSVRLQPQRDKTHKLVHKSPQDYIKGLYEIRDSKESFTLYYSNDLNPILNCVFEVLSISQNQNRGSVGKDSSYTVSFTAIQIRFASPSQVMSEPRTEFVDLFSKQQSGAGATDEPTADKEGTLDKGVRLFKDPFLDSARVTGLVGGS